MQNIPTKIPTSFESDLFIVISCHQYFRTYCMNFNHKRKSKYAKKSENLNVYIIHVNGLEVYNNQRNHCIVKGEDLLTQRL